MSGLIRDGLGLTGCALIALGIGMIDVRAGIIAAGMMLVTGAWLSAKAG